MNFQNIYQYIETEEIGSEQIEKELIALTEKYPWFEGGQLLAALYKHKYVDKEDAQQIDKAQLYINNPLWLHWQIIKSKKEITNNISELKDSIKEMTAETVANINNEYLPNKDEKVKQNNDELSFEPLHTIDYFASQGIKLQQEQLGNDNFSRQVKTFTEWLKSMKKIYNDAAVLSSENEDRNIAQMADASNNNEEIFTETMAEALMSQGKKKQAIAIYEKLSLLYPEKSSYFTSRILDLNK
jgi:hypothetical protein